MKFGIFLNSANLVCRSTDISKCFRGSLRLRENETQLYIISEWSGLQYNIPVAELDKEFKSFQKTLGGGAFESEISGLVSQYIARL